MNITCPYCQSRLDAPDELAARAKVSCTVCHKSFVYRSLDVSSSCRDKGKQLVEVRHLIVNQMEEEQLVVVGYLIVVLKVLAISCLILSVVVFFVSLSVSKTVWPSGVLIVSAFGFWMILSFFRLLFIITNRLAARDKEEAD